LNGAAHPAGPAALLAQGARHYAAGRLENAEILARQCLQLAPGGVAARHLLAACRMARGALDEGVALLEEVLAAQPGNDEARLHLAAARARQGHHQAVVDLLDELVRRRPGMLQAYSPLATAQWELGDRAGAIATYRALVDEAPEDGPAHSALGDALRQHGALDAAVTLLRRARGLLCRDVAARPLDQAAQAWLLRARIGLAEALVSLARALPPGGPEEAEAAAEARAALALAPTDPVSLTRIGVALHNAGDLAGAAAALGAVDLTQPGADPPAVLVELANVRGRQMDHAAAECALHALLARQPDRVTANTHLSLLHLLRGDFALGWCGYEWRRLLLSQLPQPQDPRAPPWIVPRDLRGQTVRVVLEQGHGDTLQFIRYVPLLAARGARVEVVTPIHAGLATLLRGIPGVSALVERADSAPAADVVVPLLSLPLAFSTDFASIPADIPYLAVPPEKRTTWRQRLGSGDSRPRVGVVWSGSPTHGNDRLRSIPLGLFRPLLARRDLAFHVLADRLRDGDAALLGDLATVHSPIEDFADTAALVDAMDLVISVDTAVAHLAGALGRPVWMMLPRDPDWRWLLGRSDSPWYPTARLFRQPAHQAWGPVLAQVQEALDVTFR